jgi:hypothetical protein
MIGTKVSISGCQVENRCLGQFINDECVSRTQRSHQVLFRIYPIASYTGVIANASYERELELNVNYHLKKWGSRSNYRIGSLRECYGRCPDGYSCKYFEIPVFIKTTTKNKDKIIWIEHGVY